MAHIEKRGPRRYRARYRGPDGREHSETFATRRDAERFLATSEADKLRGAWVDPSLGRITFKEWTARYFAAVMHKRSTTLARDRSVSDKHLLPAFGKKPIGSITPLDVRRLVEQMNITLAPATVRTNYGVLHALFGAAVDADLLAVSPCRGIRLPAPSRGEIRFLSARELEQLADETPPKYRGMIYLAGVGGLRWSEIVGLRVGRIDFLRRTVSVMETDMLGGRGSTPLR